MAQTCKGGNAGDLRTAWERRKGDDKTRRRRIPATALYLTRGIGEPLGERSGGGGAIPRGKRNPRASRGLIGALGAAGEGAPRFLVAVLAL